MQNDHPMLRSSFFRSRTKVVAGIELGGTSAALCISDGLGNFLFKKKGIKTLPPRNPVEAIEEIATTLKGASIPFDCIGVATFGPISIQKGEFLMTPKKMWQHFPLVKEVKKHFPNIPIVLDTDVNAPAFSEFLQLKESHPNINSVAYVTIGTGIGLGLYADGKTLHGQMHPEFGHLLVRPQEGDTFAGSCPFHGPCLEGMAASGAVARRLGIDQSEIANLERDHKIWDNWCYYVGSLCFNAALAYSTDVVVVGGGIATGKGREYLYEKISEEVKKLNCGYINVPKIIPPFYGRDAGLVGAAALALYSEKFQKH